MITDRLRVEYKTVGVYSFRHQPSGAEYIGSSLRCIANRVSVHVSLLNRGLHPCKKLQELWSKTKIDEWELVVLSGDIDRSRSQETEFILKSTNLLNTYPTALGAGHQHTEETKQKIRESRQKYLETPESRVSLSERAKKQHQSGNFGAYTWKDGPDYEKISEKWSRTKENKERLREHIRDQTSEEMSRRSRCRKIFQ